MRLLRIALLVLLAIGVSIVLAQPAFAQIFTTLHSFSGTDGSEPHAGLVRDDAGNLYGTTWGGGASGAGTVFKLDTTGKEVVLHSFRFNPADGANPNAGLVRDDAGNLYGTTAYLGAYYNGTVFMVDRTGKETVLHSFNGADGAYPYANLIRDDAGNLYGTTSGGGPSDRGTVFKLDITGMETVLYSFTGYADGAYPYAGLVRDDAGNLYGTTSIGGTRDLGTVFKLDTAGKKTVLHSFNGADGAYPNAGLVRDDTGNLYGTTSGLNSAGTVFKLDAAGTLTVYAFTGSNPYAGLIRDDAGNLYGTTNAGGPSGRGTVFMLDPAGTETVLYRFTGGADGARPYAGLVRDDAGNLYGTTSSGGANSVGTVFKIAPVKPLQPLVCCSLTDLGDFYLNVYESLGLSPQGFVVGTTLRWGQPYQGFEYKKGRVLRLPTLGGDSADPRQINVWEQIIGQSQLPSGLWHATRWDHGRPIDLGTLGGGSSFAGSLNDRGDAAGNSAVLDLYDFHAAAWFNGKPVNLSLDGEIQSYANGINNRGQVTGITNYADGTWHSFIWKDGARTELPRPSGDVFSSFINNPGTVCGGANFPTGFHAYTYHHGKDLVDLDPTSVWWWSSCNGMNDWDHAVGSFAGAVGNHAFLWRNADEGMIDLNSRIPPNSGTSLFTADNINAVGQITAAGYVDGQLHGFLLTPKACRVHCASAPSNLIAWWPGDGNAKDIMSDVDGVTMGAGYAIAAVNKGFTFDGVDDYVDVPNPVSLPEISTAVTVAAWVNPQMPTPPAGEGYSEGWAFALRDPLISEGISLYLTSDGYLSTVLQADNFIWSSTWNPVIKYDGSWKHVALTADTTTGRVMLFLNGVAVQDQGILELTGQFARVQHLFFGQRQGSDTDEGPGGAMHYRGLIDEVQLFNRALAPSEILTIYQAGPKGVCKR